MMTPYKCCGLTSLRGLFSRNNMKQVTAIIVGAGARGAGYAQYALDFPDRFKVPVKVCLHVTFLRCRELQRGSEWGRIVGERGIQEEVVLSKEAGIAQVGKKMPFTHTCNSLYWLSDICCSLAQC